MDRNTAAPDPGAAPQDPHDSPGAHREVAAWVALLMRAIKTCRLYDAANPAVVRFRDEFSETTGALLEHHGTLKLDVQSNAFEHAGQTVFESQSRDDNLPGVFHRDGVRALEFHPGTSVEEVERFLDLILRVTESDAADDDLVTLLWEANLPHLVVASVPLEGDVDGVGDDAESDAEANAPVPWPGQAGSGDGGAQPVSDLDPPRSDDWSSVDGVADPETVFEMLEAISVAERSRFETELKASREQPLVTSVVEILADSLAADPTPSDREELRRFVPRVLREAIIEGEWGAATELLRTFGGDDNRDVVGPFLEGLTAPGTPVTRHAVATLDRQDEVTAAAFMDLALAFGPPSVQWLMHVLAESQERRTRQALLRTISTLVRDQPDVLLPWLADSRWYVVRNVVHIFSSIGGDAVGRLVEAVVQHPEARVRREVVDVLGKCDPELARPFLSRMLESAEPRLFGAILQRLSQDPAEEVTALLQSAFEHERFTRRTAEEKRAILMAMATRGDALLPDLDAALHRGGLFARGNDEDCQAIALCMARIGTDEARRRLEHGRKAGRSSVRRFCATALATMGASNG